MKRTITIICLLFVYSFISAQEEYELSGTISFDVSQFNGYIGSAALTIGDGGSGPYKAAMVADTSITTHTLYMPLNLAPFGKRNKLPIVAYGNGGCRNGSVEVRNFLSDIASQGFLVIAVGPFKNALFNGCEEDGRMADPQSLIDGIEWAIKQNQNTDSKFYQKIDTEKIAVMGQSCGGAMAMEASKDSRISTVVMLNSGLFPESHYAPLDNSTGPLVSFMPVTPKSYLKELKPSIAYFVGGEMDMATQNANDDFTYFENVPVIVASYDFTDKSKSGMGYGHYPATYREPNGGDFAVATIAWLDWHLKGDEIAADVFKGNPSKLEENPKWTSLLKKNID